MREVRENGRLVTLALLAGPTDGPDWMDGGSARAFLRSFQSELVVWTDGRTEPFTFVRPSVAVVIVIVTVSLVACPVALAQRGRRKNLEVRDGVRMGREEDRGIRSAKLSPSFSHVVRRRVGTWRDCRGQREEGREARAR